jgi:hypothetical protein
MTTNTNTPTNNNITTKPKRCWRNHISVHPAAELFPLMGEAELRELANDIEKNSLHEKVDLYDGKVLDGQH